MIDVGVCCIFALWIVLTVVVQVRSHRAILWLGIAPLIPNWRFFSPTALSSDYVLCLRFMTPDGRTSQWFAISVPRHRYVEGVYNPSSRFRNGIIDFVEQLKRDLREPNDIRCSPGYLGILGLSDCIAAPKRPERFQFMVCVIDHRDYLPELTAFFTSDVHRGTWSR
jgi:hypothetical protein